MAVFWTFMFIISLAGFLGGVIRPSLFSGVLRTDLSRKKAALIFGGIFIIVLILGTIFPASK